jgi:hypothetical protein
VSVGLCGALRLWLSSPNIPEWTDDDAALLPTSVIYDPPPLYWPQQDDRTRRAIQNGDRIDPRGKVIAEANGRFSYYFEGSLYEAPVPKLATVVSAFYEISDGNGQSGKHAVQEYEQWMRNFLTMTDPLVIFCEPNSTWYTLIQQHRRHTLPRSSFPCPFSN